MKPEYILAVSIIGLLVLAFIAYLVRDRLSNVSWKKGDNEVSLNANARTPGVTATEVTSKRNANIIDETGTGVAASKITAEGDANIVNRDPRKNG
jgi:hypothetical protein